MRFYIYKLYFESGATYIGQHVEKLENDGYITSSSYYIKNIETDPLIKREVLIEVEDKETLDIMETLCIRSDKCSNHKNVNKNFGNWHYAYCFTGQKHSEESKRKIGESHYKAGSEVAIMIGKKNKGRKNTEQTIKLMSESAKASWTEERKNAAKSSGNYSHAHSEETKKVISDMRMNRKWIHKDNIEKSVKPEEVQSYIDCGWTIGKVPVSDDTRKRQSEAAKARCKLHSNSLGRKWIHKNGERKYVKAEELQSFLSEGWLMGMPPKC